MAIFRAELPLCPSLNMAYSNNYGGKGRGRFARPHVISWKSEAGWLIKQANPPRITGPFKLTVLVPAKMRGDVDNRIKLISDLLGPKGVRVTPDDSKAVETTCRRDASVAPGRMAILVESV